MTNPFHLSIVVPHLQAAKEFYAGVLGCSIGRDHGNWVDVLFFGHQLTLHQQQGNLTCIVIDHFGPVLARIEWLAVSERCKSNQVKFEMWPVVMNHGAETESGKFSIKDPAGNVLEFKYYMSFAATVAGVRT